MAKIVALLSGGMDSTVLLTYLLRSGHEVWSLSFDYSQRHNRELGAATQVAQVLEEFDNYHGNHIVDMLDIGCELLKGSSQTSDDIEVPHGHYAAENMKSTVVPNRNMILLALAVGYAVSIKAEYVAYGAHAGDHAIYPDCRPEFTAALAGVIALCDYNPPKLYAPFIHLTKSDLVVLGHKQSAPLADTYSCYEGLYKHCGLCGTCQERKEAFVLAGVSDPTNYADRSYTTAPLGIAPVDLRPIPQPLPLP